MSRPHPYPAPRIFWECPCLGLYRGQFLVICDVALVSISGIDGSAREIDVTDESKNPPFIKAQMAGRRIGYLRVTHFNRTDHAGLVLWLCRCDCGAHVWKSGDNLRRGLVKSCGYGHRYNWRRHREWRAR